MPAPRNRTLQLTEAERSHYLPRLLRLTGPADWPDLCDRIVCQDLFEMLDWLPAGCVDLLFVDPPYNLRKQFNQRVVKPRSLDGYTDWVESWLSRLVRVLKPKASVYLCGDWRSSIALYDVASRYFIVQNRITWEREKGRAARNNWKNCSEDIWFCTVAHDYYFNADAVRLKRRVVAPYTTNGKPKDWQRNSDGDFRLTAASNLWTDLTVPFWSMPENTNHPTQKPEKLLAKIILASSPPGAVVLDPFLGSGTTAVVAKKLDRHFVGIELDEYYACLAEKRLARVEGGDRQIQGYQDQVFWERNTLSWQKKTM